MGVAGATVLTAWTSTLLRALAARGLDATALALEAGIGPDDLVEPDRRVPQAASTRLWHLAVERTGDPALGLDVSRYVRPGTFHTLGHAVLTSPTLRDALHRIARYSEITADTARASVEERRGEVTLVLRWVPGGDRPAHEAVDAVLASIVRSARFMLDRSAAPIAVHLERPAPTDPEPYAHLFRGPITFGAPEVRLAFDAATADRPVAGGNDGIARTIDVATAAYLAQRPAAPVGERLRPVLARLLPGGEPTVRGAARAMGTSPRTLQRLLHEEGTSFRDVLRDVRRELAERYLAEGTHSVTEITYLLGFTETPAFSRAFKQWTGVAPTSFARR